jgi:hypothetical protein
MFGQVILDRISGRKILGKNNMDVDGADVDITNVPPDSLGVRPLEERKLDYMHLKNGVQPRSQSSVKPFFLYPRVPDR